MTNRNDEAYNLYQRYGDYRKVAAEMNISLSAARGMASRGRRAQPGTVIELGDMREPDAMYEPSIADTLHDYNEYTDWMRWAKRKGRTVKVQVWPDVHLPDENPQAIELAFQIAKDFKPDLNLFNGDALDLDLMSTKFPRSHSRKRVDAFKEVKPRLAALVERQLKTIKDSKTLISGGNHGRGRVENWINEHAWMLGETILEDFIQLMRCDGLAWWMGWRDEFQIGSLHAEHGIRVGEYAAKRSLLDLGGAMDRFSSHTHQPSYALNVVYESDGIAETHRRVVESVVTGCLCNIHPHYKRDKKKSRWVNGCLLIHIDMENGIPHLQPRIFKPTAGGLLTTAFGDKVYTVNGYAQAERKIA
jgi:hypothetical protein